MQALFFIVQHLAQAKRTALYMVC